MCYENYTQHNGCGHIGASHTNPWTLCITAQEKLAALRGPNSSILLPSPTTTSFFAPPKRSSTLKRSFTLNSLLSRNPSRSSTSTSRRAISGPAANPNRASTSTTSSLQPAGNHDLGVADHEMREVRCEEWECERREVVSSEMDVCGVCREAIEKMRDMIGVYDRTGVVKGMAAYEGFLRGLGELR